MKRIKYWLLGTVVLCMALVSLPQQKAKAQPGVSVSFQMFYDELSPYGQWIDDPEYGYVWVPDVDNDFRPYYSGGHWVMTEYGNTWISDYDWGWAPFHYGRWTYDSYYGWVWIPGDQWGPAWVSWRSGGGYYGWAPLGPGISFNISWGAPYDWWTFIPCQYIYSPNYYSYWRGPRYNTTYFNQTVVINNYYNNRYVYGPRRNDIERHIGGRVSIYNIRDERRPGRARIGRNEVSVYRPRVERAFSGNSRIAPRNAVRAERPIGREINSAGGSRFDRNSRISQPNRSFDRQPQQVDRPFGRGRDNQNERIFRERQDVQRQQQMEREQAQRQEGIRRQRDLEMSQRQNEQRMQMERTQRDNELRNQRAMQEQQRQNEMRNQRAMQEQRDNEMRRQRDNEMRAMQEQRRQQMDIQRQQQMQQQRQQQMESQRQQQMQQRQQQMEMQRQQQMQQRQQMDVQRQQQMERPQREWRRPEPQPAERQQRFERPQQMERPQMERGGGERGNHFGRGR